MVGAENNPNNEFELAENDPRKVHWLPFDFESPEADRDALFQAKYRATLGRDQDSVKKEIIARNYAQAVELEARWDLYPFAEPYVDLNDVAANAVALKRGQKFLDVGTHKGVLPHLIRTKYQHVGRIIGIEPSAALIEEPFWGSEPLDIELMVGDATHIPLANNSVDVLTAMFMMYHMSRDEQQLAIQEFKRVLNPGGLVGVATSGDTNKYRHRDIEKQIATILSQHIGIEYAPPQIMNSSFTSGYAMKFMSEHFKYVHYYPHEATLTLDSEQKINAYRKSLLSMRDQFYPEPDPAYFTVIVNDFVKRLLLPKTHTGSPITDHVSRMFLVGSDVKRPAPKGFRLLRGFN